MIYLEEGGRGTVVIKRLGQPVLRNLHPANLVIRTSVELAHRIRTCVGLVLPARDCDRLHQPIARPLCLWQLL